MKVLYIEDNETIPAHIVQEDTDPAPPGFTLSVSDSDWTPSDRPVKLLRYLATDGTDHRQIIYDKGLATTRLHKYFANAMVFRGQINEIEFHPDGQINDLVVKEVYNYVRQPSGLMTMANPLAVYGDADWFGRRCVHTWYREDGTAHPATKTSYKLYSLHQAGAEEERRRKRLITALKLHTLTLLILVPNGANAVDPASPTAAEMQTATDIGIPYFAGYATQIASFEGTGDLTWKGDIDSDTETWLSDDVTAWGFTGPTVRDEIKNGLKGIME